LSKKDQQEVASILTQRLANVPDNLELITFTPEEEGDCEYCEHLKTLASELASLSSGKISTRNVTFEGSRDLALKYRVKRAPATVLTILDGSSSSSPQDEPAVKFYGLPSGHEFAALLEDISDVARRRPSGLSPEAVEKMRNLKSKVHIQVFVTPTCPYCPKVVRTAHMLSIANPSMVDAEMIEAMEFPELSEKYSVMSVPKVVINDSVEFEGALPEFMFLSKIEEALLSQTQKAGLESAASETASHSARPITLTDANFSESVKGSRLLVVDFWAPWCAPCRAVSPVLEQLAGQFAGRVSFGKLNVDENPITSGQFRVEGIPTIMIFKDGKQVDSMIGAYPKSIIESKIREQM
jgi:thioredoxin